MKGKMMRWTDRAVDLSRRLELLGAPPEIVRAADDAIQHFVWATDCRRQANAPYAQRGDDYQPGWGAKADKAHYHGKKCLKEAQKWMDEYMATNPVRPIQ